MPKVRRLINVDRKGPNWDDLLEIGQEAVSIHAGVLGTTRADNRDWCFIVRDYLGTDGAQCPVHAWQGEAPILPNYALANSNFNICVPLRVQDRRFVFGDSAFLRTDPGSKLWWNGQCPGSRDDLYNTYWHFAEGLYSPYWDEWVFRPERLSQPDLSPSHLRRWDEQGGPQFLGTLRHSLRVRYQNIKDTLRLDFHDPEETCRRVSLCCRELVQQAYYLRGLVRYNRGVADGDPCCSVHFFRKSQFIDGTTRWYRDYPVGSAITGNSLRPEVTAHPGVLDVLRVVIKHDGSTFVDPGTSHVSEVADLWHRGQRPYQASDHGVNLRFDVQGLHGLYNRSGG